MYTMVAKPIAIKVSSLANETTKNALLTVQHVGHAVLLQHPEVLGVVA